MRVTLTRAISDPALPVGEMLLISAATLPRWVRQEAKRATRGRGWTEMYQPLKSLQSPESGCKFGCKVYARRRGAVIEYGMVHSLTYGHSHSPKVR